VWWLIGVAVVVVVALVVVFTVVLPGQQHNRAQTAYTHAQNNLANTITASQPVANTANSDQLDDPSTLDTLNQALTAANNYAAPGTSLDTSTLTSETDTVNNLTSDLSTAADAVKSSQTTWAKNTLTAAITQAQTAHDTSAGASSQSLADLQTQLDDANTLLAGMDKADPATVGASAVTAAAALTTAEQNVQATMCGGITLPAGVDPMVCGNGMPSGAVAVTPTPAQYVSYTIFSLPSGNIACWLEDTGAGEGTRCSALTQTWTEPPEFVQCDEVGDCFGQDIVIENGVVGASLSDDCSTWGCMKGSGEVATVPVAQYGQVMNLNPVACLSATDGVTCWDTNTHHGFKMSEAQLQYW